MKKTKLALWMRKIAQHLGRGSGRIRLPSGWETRLEEAVLGYMAEALFSRLGENRPMNPVELLSLCDAPPETVLTPACREKILRLAGLFVLAYSARWLLGCPRRLELERLGATRGQLELLRRLEKSAKQ